MASLLEKLGEWSNLMQKDDDDIYDRLSYQYTASLLIAASLCTGGRQLVADRIRCWTPADITSQQAEYCNNLCYVTSTYYVPMDSKYSIL